jgi:hypothetical protein
MPGLSDLKEGPPHAERDKVPDRRPIYAGTR